MSKRKNDAEDVPAQIVEWQVENPFAAAEQFGEQVRQDAFADVAMGKSIEDARLIARGLAHDEGSQKDRGSRRPLLDDWLDARLKEHPFTNDELFNFISEQGNKLYRDGNKIGVDGQKTLLGRSGFDKRVTQARKRIAPR